MQRGRCRKGTQSSELDEAQSRVLAWRGAPNAQWKRQVQRRRETDKHSAFYWPGHTREKAKVAMASGATHMENHAVFSWATSERRATTATIPPAAVIPLLSNARLLAVSWICAGRPAS